MILPIIPAPQRISHGEDFMRLPLKLPVAGLDQVAFDAAVAPLRPWMKKLLPEVTFASSPEIKSAALRISKNDDSSPESYSLHTRTNYIEVGYSDSSGLFYGLLTLLQLLISASQESDHLLFPRVHVDDSPRFRWRGMHLDVARHFFPVDVIKRYLDVLAWHKINVFHWHLTDDQGWRIEILSHLYLTEVGAWRTEADGNRYGGYYSQEDIRDIVQYATDRHITVVPEIEMPGHSRAALAAYPELSCTGVWQPVPSTWGIFDDVFCAGNEDIFSLLEDVLGEVCELFPGGFIHIGGDECPKTRWANCPKCQKRMNMEGLSNLNELQSWFIRRIEIVLRAHHKRLIGWDEILEGGLTKTATVMAWRSTEHGLNAAKAGHEVVMSATSHCYFDYAQAEAGEPEAFEAVLTLDQVLKFDPAPDSLPDETRPRILGGQGNLWTERIDNESHLQYMLLPRLCAMSERLWSSPTSVNTSSFHERLPRWLNYLDASGYNYRPK